MTEEEIDNYVKVTLRGEEEPKDGSKPILREICSPDIYLDGIEFNFIFRYDYELKFWNLAFMITGDVYRKGSCYRDDFVDCCHFKSESLKELIIKYLDNKFLYDKYFNRIVKLDKYEENKLKKKLFPSNVECCVCLESVACTNKTLCNHILCVECHTKIKGRKCPMCKSYLCCGQQECESCDIDDDY